MSVGTNKQTDAEREAALKELDSLDPNAADPDQDDDADDDGATGDDGADTGAGDAGDDQSADDNAGAADEGNTNDDEAAKAAAAAAADKAKAPTDYEKKFADSTREAQRLANETKTYQEKIEEAENLADPTDEECIKEYGDAFGAKDEVDKDIARQVLKAKRYQAIIRSVHAEQKAQREFIDKATTFAIDPETLKQFPFLEGRQEEFAKFASRPNRRDVLALDDIAAIFNTARPVRAKAPAGAMMERANASSDKKAPTKSTLTADQTATLRTADPRAYQKAIREGKIDPTKMLD